MQTKTFVVPNIGCDGCVRTIKNELTDLAGVASVNGNKDTKVVTVAWDDRTSWDVIKAKLAEIDYPIEEPLMPA